MTSSPYCLASDPLESKTTGREERISRRNLRPAAESESRSMVTTCSPCARYLSCRVCIQGNEARHGAHHEAQKSKKTTRPARGIESPTTDASVVTAGLDTAMSAFEDNGSTSSM